STADQPLVSHVQSQQLNAPRPRALCWLRSSARNKKCEMNCRDFRLRKVSDRDNKCDATIDRRVPDRDSRSVVFHLRPSSGNHRRDPASCLIARGSNPQNDCSPRLCAGFPESGSREHSIAPSLHQARYSFVSALARWFRLESPPPSSATAKLVQERRLFAHGHA